MGTEIGMWVSAILFLFTGIIMPQHQQSLQSDHLMQPLWQPLYGRIPPSEVADNCLQRWPIGSLARSAWSHGVWTWLWMIQAVRPNMEVMRAATTCLFKSRSTTFELALTRDRPTGTVTTKRRKPPFVTIQPLSLRFLCSLLSGTS